MAAWIDKAPSSQAGLVQRTRMVLVALTLAIGVSFLAGSAWLYPTRFAPWNSIGRPIESVHVPDSVHALTKRDVPVEGASPLSVDAYNALRIVQWASFADMPGPVGNLCHKCKLCLPDPLFNDVWGGRLNFSAASEYSFD
jgi:hypothetical protein